MLAGIAVLWLLAAACVSQAPEQLPPRVIDCSPKPFGANVEAFLPEISITFDRPMNTSSRSGFGSIRFLGVFPADRNAQPAWDATGTICRLPVQLEPDVTYAVAVNTSKQRAFTDQAGVPALGFAWVFATGARTEDDFPPHVVSSDPPLGATDVDFRKREISVTFNRPIALGDYSWVVQKGSGEYPGTREGGPRA